MCVNISFDIKSKIGSNISDQFKVIFDELHIAPPNVPFSYYSYKNTCQ